VIHQAYGVGTCSVHRAANLFYAIKTFANFYSIRYDYEVESTAGRRVTMFHLYNLTAMIPQLSIANTLDTVRTATGGDQARKGLPG
jgi:hypothetical protein